MSPNPALEKRPVHLPRTHLFFLSFIKKKPYLNLPATLPPIHIDLLSDQHVHQNIGRHMDAQRSSAD